MISAAHTILRELLNAKGNLKTRLHTSIEQIPESAWNALIKDNHPLLSHEFLAAMERNHCVGERFGWLPRHLGVYQGERLVGAMPLYEKYNSLGEFVFDHTWAQAYEQMGMRYFPKLVSAIPYTPVTGQRLLSEPGRENDVFPLLLEAVLDLARKIDASSFHCLFPSSVEHLFLEHNQLLSRHDCQFHWENRNYQDFDDFLVNLTSRKRKKIRQERSKVANAGVKLRILDGHTARDQDWQDFTSFYNYTFEEKWGIAVFNQTFFQDVARQLPEQVVLVLADLDGECIAGALMYRSDTTLYGRHWGSVQYVDSLHFEVCYYQGIEYCIRHGLTSFEPGAQGEHKIARGFIPTLTRSSHWLADERFQAPVADFTRRERQAVAAYIRQLQSILPYRQEVEL